MDYKEIWAIVVNYTFGEGTVFATKMIEIDKVNSKEVKEYKKVFKELIIEMRKNLFDKEYIDSSLADDTENYKKRFRLASMNTVKNKKYGSYEIDGILYNNEGTIACLYSEDGIKQCPTSKLTHIYYNELDHYFTHVLNFYPLVKEEDRDKLLALQIPPRNVGTATEYGIYAVICDSLIGSKICKLDINKEINTIDDYKSVIREILDTVDLEKRGRK